MSFNQFLQSFEEETVMISGDEELQIRRPPLFSNNKISTSLIGETLLRLLLPLYSYILSSYSEWLVLPQLKLLAHLSWGNEEEWGSEMLKSSFIKNGKKLSLAPLVLQNNTSRWFFDGNECPPSYLLSCSTLPCSASIASQARSPDKKMKLVKSSAVSFSSFIIPSVFP